MAVSKSFRVGYLVDYEEELFKQYYTVWGKGATFEKLRNWWTKEHGVNPNTGKPFSVPAFHQACWRWGLRNLDEAREMFSAYALLYGERVTDEIWKKFIQERARDCLKGGARTFFNDHPEYAPEGEE